MGKIRFIAIGKVFDDETLSTDDVENLRQEIQSLCESYEITDVKVNVEDDYCIKVNDYKSRIIT